MIRFLQKEAMMTRSCYLIAFIILSLIGENKITNISQYLKVQTPYDLSSDDAITRYLPHRLNLLVNYTKTNGLAAATQSIAKDPDLDSYLFIIEAEKPHCLIAYSRHTEWHGKTPTELQNLFAHQNAAINIPHVVTSLINLTQIGPMYLQYNWPPHITSSNQQIAYAMQLVVDNKSYVLGATRYISESFERIALPRNLACLIERIKKDGLEKITQILLQNKDPEYNFVICTADPPYRYVVNTQAPQPINMTPEELQFYDDPTEKDAACDYPKIIKQLLIAAQLGGGYHAYLCHRSLHGPIVLCVAYATIFKYEKRPYLAFTSFTPPLKNEVLENLQKTINNTYQLIQEVKLDNTISMIKKSKDFVYLYNTNTQQFSYHPNQQYNQRSCKEVEQYIQSFGKIPGLNLCASLGKTTELVRDGDNFCAFEFSTDPKNPQKGVTLRLAYIKPFKYQNQFYWMASASTPD